MSESCDDEETALKVDKEDLPPVRQKTRKGPVKPIKPIMPIKPIKPVKPIEP